MLSYESFEHFPLNFVLGLSALKPWWRKGMEICSDISTLLALCEGNHSITSGFPSQMARDIDDIFFLVSPNKPLKRSSVASNMKLRDTLVTSPSLMSLSAILASVSQASIGSDNGLSPVRRQAIIWTKAGILSIGPLGKSFSELVIRIQHFLYIKMHLKMSSAKWRLFCPGWDEVKLPFPACTDTPGTRWEVVASVVMPVMMTSMPVIVSTAMPVMMVMVMVTVRVVMVMMYATGAGTVWATDLDGETKKMV